MGSRSEKVSHEEEQAFLDELMVALSEKFPDIVIQFEDWYECLVKPVTLFQIFRDNDSADPKQHSKLTGAS